MRNGVRISSPRVSLPLYLLCVVTLFGITSCGSGSGGGGGTSGGGGGGGGTGKTVSGVVRDFNVNGVKNALIQVTGTSLSTTTDANGIFTLTNVPPTATSIQVTRPGNTGYYNVAVFYGKTYDLVGCTIPLPNTGLANVTLTDITMYGGPDPNNPPPPPPPTSGCP